MVGIESEYFVYTMYHTYVWEMNLVCAYHIIVCTKIVDHVILILVVHTLAVAPSGAEAYDSIIY